MARREKFDLEEFSENPSHFPDQEEPGPSASGGDDYGDDVQALELGDSRNANRFSRLNDEELFGKY